MYVVVRCVYFSGKPNELLIELVEITDNTGKGTVSEVCDVWSKNGLDLECIANLVI